MQIFLTDRSIDVGLVDHLVELPGAAKTLLASGDAVEDMPFVLSAGGDYEHVLNAFFRHLPHLGVSAPNSWRTYATQLVPLARYICGTCGRRSLAAGTLQDFQGYRSFRRNARDPQVTAGSWNVLVAALDKFFQFLKLYGYIDETPFRYAERRLWVNGHIEVRDVNSLYESVVADDVVRCLSIEEYEFFRDHGLRASDTRNATRDVALAELLVTTGMRITECLVLLTEELPPADARSGQGASETLLSESTTKRLKARHIWVSHRVMKHYVDRYARTDRAHAVTAARHAGRYEGLRTKHLVLEVGSDGVDYTIEGRTESTPFTRLTVPLRRALYRAVDGVAAEPMALWCDEKGMPLSDAAVRMAFRRACERCNENDEARKRFGRPMKVSPHTLRHTFAVAHLSQLIREAGLTIPQAGDVADAVMANDCERLRRVLTSPMNQLRKTLGHRSEATTYKYLTYLEQARATALAAVRGWDSLLTQDHEQTRRHHAAI